MNCRVPYRRVLRGPVNTLATLLIPAMVVAFPTIAAAQPEVFFQRLVDLTAALEGTYGDEGPRIGETLDQMSRALAEWDRRIEALEVRLASEPANAPRQEAVDTRVSLARMYAQRGRTDDALRELDRAIRLEPGRADVHLLRGVVLESSGKASEAADAFAMAWTLDASDPVKAYFLLRDATSVGKSIDVQAVRGSLDATYRRLLTERTRPRTPPFPDTALIEHGASDTLLLPAAAYARAYAHIAHREYDEGLAEFRTVAATDPIVADPATRSRTLAQAVGALREGRPIAARSLENSDALQASEAHRVLGLIYWAGSEDDKSVEQLTTSIRRNPRDERSRLALFHVLRLAGRDADAAATLQEAIRILPDSVRAHWWLGLTYERLNRFVEARQEFEHAAAGAIAGRSAVYAAIGRLAAREADLPAAAVAFAHAISANPNDHAAHSSMAQVLLQQDRTDDALVEWIAALLIDPLDADAHAGIGQLFLDVGRNGDAVGALRRAVELSPDHTEARYALAIALTRVGNTKEADREFARVEREQRQTLAERRLTMSLDVLKEEAGLRAAEGDYERAAALWRQVIDREPAQDPVVYRELADVYEKLGRVEDAARARAMYRKALQSPDRGSAR